MIILMGIAGAGKGTQGKMLADMEGYLWISTGEILRQHASEDQARRMLAGELLHDDELIQIVDMVLGGVENQDRIILDGFPRTMQQAEWLITRAKDKKLHPIVFHLIASHEVVKKRLALRGRPDDADGVIARRFRDYETITEPIIDYFVEQGLDVYDIDANKTPEEVHAAIVSYLR